MAFDERINCVDEKKRTEEAKLFIKHSRKTLICRKVILFSFMEGLSYKRLEIIS
jgi:hypothetical protein